MWRTITTNTISIRVDSSLPTILSQFNLLKCFRHRGINTFGITRKISEDGEQNVSLRNFDCAKSEVVQVYFMSVTVVVEMFYYHLYT